MVNNCSIYLSISLSIFLSIYHLYIHLINACSFFQALDSDMLRKSSDHDTLNATASSVLSSADTDHEAIQDTLDNINGRWDELADNLSDKMRKLKDTSDRLREMNDVLNDLKGALRKHEDKMDAITDPESAADKRKNLDKLRVRKNEIICIFNSNQYRFT